MSTRKSMRLIFAAFFTMLLFAEWGSHGVIIAHHYGGGESTVSGSERGHDDPCKTLICNQGQRKDQGIRFSHQTSQHNAFFNTFSTANKRLIAPSNQISHSSLVFEIFRPPDPSFHPPEIS